MKKEKKTIGDEDANKLKIRRAIANAVNAGLSSAIGAHGPIVPENKGSAIKRIEGELLGLNLSYNDLQAFALDRRLEKTQRELNKERRRSNRAIQYWMNRAKEAENK